MNKLLSILLAVLCVASLTACKNTKPSIWDMDDEIVSVTNIETVTREPETEVPATETPEPITDAPETEVPATETPEPITDAPTPVPVTPVPVTPVPVTPVPVTPVPVTPAPVTPAPVTPAPVTPAPVTPVPVTPVPGNGTVAPVPGQKCYYGKYTGTSSTYTGYEPLPYCNFNNPTIANTGNLSTARRDHGFGVAKNGKVGEESVANQNFFKQNKLDAIVYDQTAYNANRKVLYLTFDLGYENGYTAKILDTLKAKNVKAAFFCTLPELKSNTTVMKRIITEGHILGNHSCTHPDFSTLSRQQVFNELKGFDDYLRAHYGYSALYFRYPMGRYNVSSLDLINKMGYTGVFWSFAYADWDLNNQRGADYAHKIVTERLHPGAVLLLHAVSPDNANALGRIIDTARSMGYEFRPLTDYHG